MLKIMFALLSQLAILRLANSNAQKPQLLVVVLDDINFRESVVFVKYPVIQQLVDKDFIAELKTPISYEDIVAGRKNSIDGYNVRKIFNKASSNLLSGNELVVVRIKDPELEDVNKHLGNLKNKLTKAGKFNTLSIMIVGTETPGIMVLSSKMKKKNLAWKQEQKGSIVIEMIDFHTKRFYEAKSPQLIVIFVDGLNFNDAKEFHHYDALDRIFGAGLTANIPVGLNPYNMSAFTIGSMEDKNAANVFPRVTKRIIKGDQAAVGHVTVKNLNVINVQLKNMILKLKAGGSYYNTDIYLIGTASPAMVMIQSENLKRQQNFKGYMSEKVLNSYIISRLGPKGMKINRKVMVTVMKGAKKSVVHYFPNYLAVDFLQKYGVTGLVNNVDDVHSFMTLGSDEIPIWATTRTICVNYDKCCSQEKNVCVHAKYHSGPNAVEQGMNALINNTHDLVLVNSKEQNVRVFDQEFALAMDAAKENGILDDINFIFIGGSEEGFILMYGPDIATGKKIDRTIGPREINGLIAKLLRVPGPPTRLPGILTIA